MPDAVNQRYISINAPEGRVNMTNPLYRYDFHPHPSVSEFPLSDAVSQYKATVRYPDANGKSQPWKSNAQLQANAPALHDLTYQLLAEQSNYAPFSNRGYSIGRNATYNSIENLHNAIHSLVGQTGHMGMIPYSSFDPIFWLHHANVDRLVAIWQALYPESFVTPQVSYEGTYTEVPGTIETIYSPLTLFYSNDDNGTFFTSASARYLRYFGYTYPETIDWNVTTTQLSLNVRRILNSLYNPAGTLSARSLSETYRPAHKPREWSIHTTDKVTRNHRLKSPPFSDTESRNFQYLISIRVERLALNQSFFVHFFLGTSSKAIRIKIRRLEATSTSNTLQAWLTFSAIGPMPQHPSSWSTAPTLIGTQAVLYSPSHLTISNDNSTAYGQIPLNHALTSSSPHSPNLHPRSLAPSDVIPVLTQHLTWKLQTLNPSTNEEESINVHSYLQLRRTLKIFVIGREVVREGQDDQLPVYGPVEIWRAATEGKAGSLGEDEGM